MSVKTNVPPSCSLQTQTTRRQVPGQPRPRGLLAHNHSFNPGIQSSGRCCDGTVTPGHGKDRPQSAEMGPPRSAPAPFLSKPNPSCWPTPGSRGAFWGLRMLVARLGFPVFPARAEMCQGSHTWPQSVPSPQAAETVVGIISHDVFT